MSKLTALQQAMRIVEKHAHNLFNVYNADSRAFLDEMSKCLELEREQMEEAVSHGISNADMTNNRGYFDFDKYYNETYKGGEQ